MKYTGLPDALRAEVIRRDIGSDMEVLGRCRWCGRTGPVDLHHIRYRRGIVDDVAENLISLCRFHHGFVHGVKPAGGVMITKRAAQKVLFELVEAKGQTGAALWRIKKRGWEQQGLCSQHGDPDCMDCDGR